jgi:hypothetical protein
LQPLARFLVCCIIAAPIVGVLEHRQHVVQHALFERVDTAQWKPARLRYLLAMLITLLKL